MPGTEPAQHGSAVPADAVRWRGSLRTRIALWSGAVNVIVLLLVTAATAWFVRDLILDNARRDTLASAQEAAQRLQTAMRSVQITTSGLSELVAGSALDESELTTILRALVRATPGANGGLLVLEAGNGQAPYARYIAADGRDRDFLRIGFDKLKAAGFAVKDGRLTGPDGKPLAFEMMLKGRENEGIAMAWHQTLRALGIELTIRSVDASQFLQRQINYDFDAMVFNYTASLSPGVEQMTRWGAEAADRPGTFNYAGVKNPAVEGLIATMLATRDRPAFVDAVRAYDRVLMSGSYVVPLYYRPEQWVAHWSRIKRPEKTPLVGYQLMTWWRQAN